MGADFYVSYSKSAIIAFVGAIIIFDGAIIIFLFLDLLFFLE
jgi:hypothetical protein